MPTSTRRSFLRSATALSGAALIGAPWVARSRDPIKVSLGGMSTGWSKMATDLMIGKGIARASGVAIEPAFYPTLRPYYADFVAGRIDVAMGAWDFFALQQIRGVPIKLLGAVTTYSMAGFFVGPDGPRSLGDLKGKTVAALQGGGLYTLTKAMLKKYSGIELEKEVAVQNVPNPPATVSMVAASRADAGLIWEPGISQALAQIPGARVLITIQDYLKQTIGRGGPYFSLAVREELLKREPGVAPRLVDMYTQLFKYISANPTEYQKMGEAQKLDPAILKVAMDSGRMAFSMQPMSDAGNREEVRVLASILTEAGQFPSKLSNEFFVL